MHIPKFPTTRVWIKPVVLAAVVWAVYANSLGGPFAFDDWHVIPNNPSVHDLALVPSFFTDISHFSVLVGNQGYRPVFLTSMALAWWLGGGATLPFHVVSVTLHMANVLMLFLIFRSMFSSVHDTRGGLSPPRHEWAALLAAGLFAVHPLASESVNYISSQAVPLAAFFYLLAFYAFISVYGRWQPLSHAGRRLRLAGSYAAYFLALLSKPIAITLPLILLLWDLLFGGGDKDAGAGWKRYLLRVRKHLPYLAVTLVFLLIRAAAIGAPAGAGQPARTVYIHYLTQTKALVFYYLKLALAPFGLNADVAYPLSTSLFDSPVVLAVAILIGIGYLLFRYRHQRIVVFWTLWFPVCLLLTTYGMVLGQLVNEHRPYLSLAGSCAVVAIVLVKSWGLLPLSVSDFSLGRRSGTALAAGAVLLVLVGLGHETRARNKVWSSTFDLWEDAALNGGTWRAHMNYGLALEGKGRADEALFQLEEAVRLGPYAFAYLNLGNAQVNRGMHETGIANLRTAVRLWPSAPEPHLYLGYALDTTGEAAEAEKEYKEAIRLRPKYLKAYRELANLYERQGRPDEAIATLERLRTVDPGDAWIGDRIRGVAAHMSAGEVNRLFDEAFAHQKDGRRERAIALYEELLHVDPNHRQGTFNLAYAYLHSADPDGWARSAQLFLKVLEIDPKYVVAIHHLASAYWKRGEDEQAVKYDRMYLEQGHHAGLRKRSAERLAAAATG